MLNAFNDLLCSKLCWHNWRVPNNSCSLQYSSQHSLGELELHDCKFHSKGLENVNNMLIINKFLDRVSILYYDDDDDDAALIVVF